MLRSSPFYAFTYSVFYIISEEGKMRKEKTYSGRAFVLLMAIVLLLWGATTRSTFSKSTSTCTATDPWGTFGHDSRRSFASNGCIWYPLNTPSLWVYQPTPAPGRLMRTVERAIADQE